MKLICLFLCFTTCFAFAEHSYAQSTKLSLHLNDVTVSEALESIEKNAAFHFFYNNTLIDMDRKVSVKVDNKDVFAILDIIFKDSDVRYKVVDHDIILTTANLIIQNGIPISGTVTDEAGEAMPGVNVVIKGTTTGVVTGVDGRYSINVPNRDAVLVFSFIGYATQELVVGDKVNIDLSLQMDMREIEEVVVIGYGTAKRRDLTGAIASVKAEKLETEAPRDITDLMRGTAAGLNVGMSTSAKGDLTPSVRGVNTLTAGSSPTIVLDGVIYYGALSDINTNDVESIDVLKDASSAAVYGSQAANGVIVITTKKGKGKSEGAPIITINSNIGFVQSANQMDILDGAGYIKYRQDYEIQNKGEAYMAQYPEMFTSPFELSNTGVNALDWYNYSQTTPVSSVTDEQLTRAWLSRLEFYSPEIENYLAGIETNWADLVLQNGLQQDHTIGISNSTDKVTYRWSLGYVGREGIVVGDEYKNIRTRLNIDSKITKFLTIGMNTNFSVRDESAIAVDWNAMAKNSPYASNNLDDPDSRYRYYVAGDAMTTNPLYAREYIDKSNYYYSLNANLYAQVKLPFGIEYQVNYTPYLQWYNDFHHRSAASEAETQGGTSYRTHNIRYHWTVDNILRWKKEIANTHNIEVTLLANAEQRKTWSTTANTYKYSPSDVLGYHNLDAGLNPTVSSSDTYWTGDALMGRLFYSYKNKYMLTTSVRRDGYSAFGRNNKRATFPSVALGYVFTAEDFMKNTSNWLNYGKLRFSWGQNGNRDIGQYAALSNMTTNNVPYIDNSGIVYTGMYMYVSTMSNRDLRWERTESYNLGLDFSLFNNVISGSAEAYLGTTKDLLVARSLPSITGFSSVTANLGKLENKGLELTLNANILKGKDLSWSASSTFSMNRRKIVALYGDMENILDGAGTVIGQKETDDPINGWFIGQDPDRIWSYKRDGVWQLGEEDQAKVYGCKPGDFKYIDQDGNGVLNNDDKVFQGYTTPRARIALRNDFTILKDLTFSFSLYSYLGYYGSFNQAANYNSGMPYRYSSYDIPRWTPDNPTNDYARISSNNKGTNWVNKSFVRLDNISISYNVPKKFLQKIFVQQMRLTFTSRNMAIWSPHWTFWDPENGSLSPRTFNFGINFTL